MIRSLLSSVSLVLLFGGALRAEDPAPAKPDEAATPAEHQGSQRVVPQGDDGVILLHARDSSVHGSTLRYEPAEAKNTVGYWFKPEDWVSWEFEVAKPGSFTVEILQGCGKGNGGADVELSVGGQAFPFVVEDTGGFQNFKARIIGTATLAVGKQTLAVKAKTRPGAAVMDLRQVTLRPVEAKP